LLACGVSRKEIVMPGHFRRNIAALAGYVPGEQPQDGGGYIKLNTNENPYPPSPRVVAAVKKSTSAALRLYPEPLSREIRELAASIYGVAPGNVLVGNGSDEVLSILARAFVGPGDRVLYPEPTYTLYDTLVAIQEGVKSSLSYSADFSLPEAFFTEKAPLTFVCNPNSPSATLLPRETIERLAQSSSGVVVVDEAYIDFSGIAGVSSIPLIGRYPNLVVLRTFSKSFSLAGMRVGLAFACGEYSAAGKNSSAASRSLASIFIRRRRTSFSRGARDKIFAAFTRSSSGGKFSCAISTSRGCKIACASPSERRAKWTHCSISWRRL
jgi:histidinol-phosphate aminotransferase